MDGQRVSLPELLFVFLSGLHYLGQKLILTLLHRLELGYDISRIQVVAAATAFRKKSTVGRLLILNLPAVASFSSTSTCPKRATGEIFMASCRKSGRSGGMGHTILR